MSRATPSQHTILPPQRLPCWLTLLLLALLSPVMLGAQGGFAKEEEFRLLVRPSICVSYDSSAPCVMSMQLSWEAPRLVAVCLRETEAEGSLRCWDDARAGQHEVQYADSADTHYLLVDAATHAVLAEAEVVVINRDLRDSRKRRRHVWSIL